MKLLRIYFATLLLTVTTFYVGCNGSGDTEVKKDSTTTVSSKLTLDPVVPYVELKIAASGTRAGMVINRPETLVPGKLYPMIIFNHGIGERGNGSLTDLEKLRVNGSVSALELNAKKYNMIVVEPQADVNWEHGETDEAYQYMKANYGANINWKKVYLTGLSLGGGGNQHYLSTIADAHTKFAAAVINCPGPNQYFINTAGYSVIANTKVPMWFFHNSGDNVVAPSQSTLLTENNIKALGGTAKYAITLYNFTGHTWPSYNRGPGLKAAVPTEATRFNNPDVNIYEWMLSNEIGKAPVMPPAVGQSPTPTPIDTVPAPIPTPAANVYIKSIYISGSSKVNDVIAEIIWTDGSKQGVRAPTGATVQYMIPATTLVNDTARQTLRVKYSNKTTSTLIGPKKMTAAGAADRPAFIDPGFRTDPWTGK